MALLKRMGLFGRDTAGASIQRAIGLEDLAGAYALVHAVFLERGYIVPQPSGLRVRPFEALPEMATFVARSGDDVVGVQSLAVDSEGLGLPSDQAFRAEIDEIRSGGRLVCEATNEAIAPDYRKTGVPTELMRCCFAHATLIGCNELMTTVSPGHAKFYDLLGFRQVSGVRSYSSTVEDPVVVVSLDLASLADRVKAIREGAENDDAFLEEYYLTGNPYHRSVAAWRTAAGRLFQDPQALRELFVARSRLLLDCTDEVLEAIRCHWSEDVWWRVWGSSRATAAPQAQLERVVLAD